MSWTEFEDFWIPFAKANGAYAHVHDRLNHPTLDEVKDWMPAGDLARYRVRIQGLYGGLSPLHRIKASSPTLRGRIQRQLSDSFGPEALRGRISRQPLPEREAFTGSIGQLTECFGAQRCGALHRLVLEHLLGALR